MSISEKYIKLTAPVIGKAGELRVRSELLLHGFAPAVCDNDYGTDIILANSGKKLQVKTSRRPHDNKNYGWKYTFSIRQTKFRNSKDGKYERSFTRKNYKGRADFFIFWCIEHDIFYIVPESEIGEKVSFVIPTPIKDRKYRINERKSKSKYEKYKNAWEVLND